MFTIPPQNHGIRRADAGARWRPPPKARVETVAIHKSPIDRRPFRSRAERECEEALENRYRSVAIPEVVAALAPAKQDDTGKAA